MLELSRKTGPHYLNQSMRAEDLCHECQGTAKTVFIDGSSYKIRDSNYSGWGIWSPDDQSFNDNGPFKRKNRVLIERRQPICQRHGTIH
eukprot:15048084-Heterocapsa_arctica.AAC.1